MWGKLSFKAVNWWNKESKQQFKLVNWRKFEKNQWFITKKCEFTGQVNLK